MRGAMMMLMLRWMMMLSLTWTGSSGFLMRSRTDALCLEDSLSGVQLDSCHPDSALQQWAWSGPRTLRNSATQRCLSAGHAHPVRTVSCESGEHVQWRCRSGRIISRTHSWSLDTHHGTLRLSPGRGEYWTNTHGSDVCPTAQRHRRDSQSEAEELEFEETPVTRGMTEEQMTFLRWYYRTEDPTPWKFAMLAFAFLGLLMGCMLMVMGMMASRTRKQIAKYKIGTQLTPLKAEPEEPGEAELELQDLEESISDGKNGLEVQSGKILVTWRDGNVSTLYPEPSVEEEAEEKPELHSSQRRASSEA